MRKLIAAGCFAALAAASNATIWGFSVPLMNGAQGVPPTGSAAYGTGSFNLDDQTWIMSGSVTITGLSVATVTGMHIHNAPVGANGPVIFDILANVAATNQSGNVSNWFFTGMLQDDGNLTRLQKLQVMVAGDSYINAHTPTFPGGEIRGQIDCVVPEPATVIPVFMGLGFAYLLKRRR
ncbi:MAG: CHRD domain-containing protein [Fimbriimonadales bacterium]